ncbi:hypothetical protein [Microbacterium aurum]
MSDTPTSLCIYDDEPPAPRPGAMRPDDLPPEVVAEAKRIAKEQFAADMTKALSATPRPINWRTLPPHDLEHELLELNQWVDWLLHTYGLPAQVVPPMWHRHPELLWELSALRQHWLFCFDPAAKGNLKRPRFSAASMRVPAPGGMAFRGQRSRRPRTRRAGHRRAWSAGAGGCTSRPIRR